MTDIDISNFYFHNAPTITIFSHVSLRKSKRKEVKPGKPKQSKKRDDARAPPNVYPSLAKRGEGRFSETYVFFIS